MHLGLINCTKKKFDGMTFAKDMYVGNSFISGRSILEHVCDEWFILSARYGLLRPDARIPSYDRALSDLSLAEYQSWCQGTAAAVIERQPTKVTIIATDEYVGYLPRVLESRGIEVDRRPRVDIYGPPWYMACTQCGACGPKHKDRDLAVEEAIGHPCRVGAL